MVVPQEQPPVLRPPSPVFCTVPVVFPGERGIRSSRIKKKSHEFRTLNRSSKVSGPSRPKVPANGPSGFLGERARGFVCFRIKQFRPEASMLLDDLTMKKPPKRTRGTRRNCLFLFFPQNKQLTEAAFAKHIIPVLRDCFLSSRVSLWNDQIHANLPDRPQVYRMDADCRLFSR